MGCSLARGIVFRRGSLLGDGNCIASKCGLGSYSFMNFPQYWARGRIGGFFAWRWSSVSQAEAQTLADEAARRLAERFRVGNYPPNAELLYYPGRPFREQIIQEFKDATGQTLAVITRNSYGCLVLNTARVMFVDIDFPEPKRTGGLLARLFRKPPPSPPPADPHQEAAMQRIEVWTRAHP